MVKQIKHTKLSFDASKLALLKYDGTQKYTGKHKTTTRTFVVNMRTWTFYDERKRDAYIVRFTLFYFNNWRKTWTTDGIAKPIGWEGVSTPWLTLQVEVSDISTKWLVGYIIFAQNHNDMKWRNGFSTKYVKPSLANSSKNKKKQRRKIGEHLNSQDLEYWG